MEPKIRDGGKEAVLTPRDCLGVILQCMSPRFLALEFVEACAQSWRSIAEFNHVDLGWALPVSKCINSRLLGLDGHGVHSSLGCFNLAGD